MRIIVKGFKHQSIVSVDQLLALIAKIPQHHIEKLRNIVYDPSRFFQRSYVRPQSINPRVSAQYSNAPWSFVVIYQFDTIEALEHMLFHEIGHHVYNHVISSSQKKRWVTEIYPQKQFISSYAKTNASEDFAETYAFFFHDRERCLPFAKKYAFIQDI